MATSLTRREEHRLAQLTRGDIDRSLRVIEGIAGVTQAAQAEIDRVFSSEAVLVTGTMQYVHDALREAVAGGMPDDEVSALCHGFEAYCQEMRGISVSAATTITQVIDTLPQRYLPSGSRNLLTNE